MGFPNPAKDILGPKYTTAFIFTGGRTVHPVVIKKSHKGFFIARINGQYYFFSLTGQDYAVRMPPPFHEPRILVYMIQDMNPIDMDEFVKLRLFAKLNPGCRITPEVAQVLMTTDHEEVYENPPGEVMTMPTEKSIAKLKTKIDQQGGREVCKVVDLDEAFGKFKHPDQPPIFNQEMINEFGAQNMVVPPVQFAPIFSPRMMDSSSFLGEVIHLAQKVNLEFRKIANPTFVPNRFWLKILLLFGIIGGVGVAGALFSGDLSGGGDFLSNFEQAIADAGLPSLDGLGGLGAAFQPPATTPIEAPQPQPPAADPAPPADDQVTIGKRGQ